MDFFGAEGDRFTLDGLTTLVARGDEGLPGAPAAPGAPEAEKTFVTRGEAAVEESVFVTIVVARGDAWAPPRGDFIDPAEVVLLIDEGTL